MFDKIPATIVAIYEQKRLIGRMKHKDRIVPYEITFLAMWVEETKWLVTITKLDKTLGGSESKVQILDTQSVSQVVEAARATYVDAARRAHAAFVPLEGDIDPLWTEHLTEMRAL
jgi:hypothetical protein